MIVAALVGLAFGVGGAVFGSKAATGLARNLRKAMFRNIQTFSFANIDKYSTAGLVTRMTTDVTNIQNAYQMILRMAIRAPSSMIIAMIMSFTINRELATIYLVAVIALGGVLMYIMSHSTRYFTEAFRKYDDLNESVQENVSAIRVVKAYVRERFEGEKFQKASENVRRLLLRAELLLSFNAPRHAADRVFLHPADLLAGRAPDRFLRRDRFHDRRTHEHAGLLYEHPHEPDDAVHGVRHDLHVGCFRPPCGRSPQRGNQPEQPRAPPSPKSRTARSNSRACRLPL